MTKPPEAPPEGVLIKKAAKAAGLSQRKAAALAGISETRWRQLVSGFQRVDGHPVPTRSKDDTLARMARPLDVTAEQLEEVGRQGAAAVLREIQAEAEAAANASTSTGSAEDGRVRVEERWHMLELVLRQAPVGLDSTEYDVLRDRIDVFFEQSPEWQPPDGTDPKWRTRKSRKKKDT